jgi:phosphopentomutase
MSDFELSDDVKAAVTRQFYAWQREEDARQFKADLKSVVEPKDITDLHWRHIGVIVRMLTDHFGKHASMMDELIPIIELRDNQNIIVNPKTGVMRAEYAKMLDYVGVKYDYQRAPNLIIKREDQG